jgi:hypothetical protein
MTDIVQKPWNQIQRYGTTDTNKLQWAHCPAQQILVISKLTFPNLLRSWSNNQSD